MDLGKIGITYEGAYDSERLYEPLSVVAHSNGGVYMSIAEVAEVDPASDATKWAVMVPPGTMTTSMISQEDVDDTKKVPSSSLFSSVISSLKNLIAEKIAKTSITNTNVNDANKVPSAALLYSLNSNLTNLVMWKNYSIPIGKLEPNEEKFNQIFKFEIPEGYESSAICGFKMIGNNFTQCVIQGCNMQGETVEYSIKNMGSVATGTDLKFYVNILFIKNI